MTSQHPDVPHRLPGYAWLGLMVMVVSEGAMLLGVQPFATWHTPIVWTGYVLLADGWTRRRVGDSWLTSARGEFLFVAAMSLPLWLVFEFYNLFIQNWHYINLPRHVVVRWLGYAWSFATIWPGIFVTADLVATFRGRGTGRTRTATSPTSPTAGIAGVLAAVVGAAMLVWPLAWPSPYLAAPVWLGFVLLLDPLNARLGGESLLIDVRQGRFDRVVNLCLAGLLCGFLWEFWNYWAVTKWVYTVPILPELKIFEMPVLGYLGFPAFALECFTMYVSVRLVFWSGRCRPISL